MDVWCVAVRRVSFEVLAARSSNLGSLSDQHVLVKSYRLCAPCVPLSAEVHLAGTSLCLLPTGELTISWVVISRAAIFCAAISWRCFDHPASESRNQKPAGDPIRHRADDSERGGRRCLGMNPSRGMASRDVAVLETSSAVWPF